MVFKMGIRLIIGLLLSASIISVLPPPVLAEIPDGDATGKAQNTRLMQQIDHQRRVRERIESKETQGPQGDMVAQGTRTEEESAAGLDLAVFVILGVSALVLFVVCRLRGRSSRECVFNVRAPQARDRACSTGTTSPQHISGRSAAAPCKPDARAGSS